MVIRLPLVAITLLALATVSVSAEDHKPHAKEVKSAVFDKFRQLEGEWVGKEKSKADHDVTVKYKLTSGGTAIMETLGAGTDHEMVTMIHPDGDDLLLTHYCMLGNQPQMKASGKELGNKVDFKFVRATNMKSDKEMHMHNVTFTFVDKDTLKTEWTNYDDGKEAGKVVFEFKRKKQDM